MVLFTRYASIAQRIEQSRPKGEIWVQFLLEAQNKHSKCESAWVFFILCLQQELKDGVGPLAESKGDESG